MPGNIFSDPAPVAFYDGVLLVEMIGDSAEALASLVAFIYDPSEVNVHRWDPDTPYRQPHGKVKDDWPLTIEDWDGREAEIEAMRFVESTSGERAPSSKLLARSVPEPASAVRFAREFGCPEILPAAYYRLSRTDATYAWDRPDSYKAHRDLSARWLLRSSLPPGVESVGRAQADDDSTLEQGDDMPLGRRRWPEKSHAYVPSWTSSTQCHALA